MGNQQKQAKSFFEKDALNWSKKSTFSSKNKILNTIHERNIYVLNFLKNKSIKLHLDVGCGTGDLAFESSKITSETYGLDFANSMIKIAKTKYRNKNLFFEVNSIFNFKTNKKFECISANGFIEYLSIKEIYKFFIKSAKLLKNNGYLIISSRNRLFNLFSLNNFTNKEILEKDFKKVYSEAIHCNLSKNLNEFIKLKTSGIRNTRYKQPNTGIDVKLRHQFTPLQLSYSLKKIGFKIIDINAINYHPVLPSIYNEEKNYKIFSNKIFKKSLSEKLNKLKNIPFSSSFMICAKKI